MKTSIVSLAAAAAVLASAGCRSTPESLPTAILQPWERAEGWRLLFDGRTTDGWRGYRREGVPDGWEVRQGCLARTGPGGDLITEETFSDFILELEWTIVPGGNSGIFFRVDEDHQYTWESGPEMQILDNAPHADGLDPRTSAGANYALHTPSVDTTRPAGKWNHARLEVVGDRVTHVLNGHVLFTYRLWTPEWERLVKASKFASMPAYGRNRSGHIALQDHGDEVAFRNIKILELKR